MPFSGSEQMRAVARDLRAAGSPARGLRSKMRRNITVAMTPMKKQVQANALAIPVKGPESSGLRVALAKATRISITPGGRNISVALVVDGKKMSEGQQSLPAAMEGEGRPWRHPVFGDDEVWVRQASHPFVAPAILPTVLAAERGINAAVDATVIQLVRGKP